MAIHTRIDFRLIHGQVMTRWVKTWSIKQIVVIDDTTANSIILKKIVLSSAPKGMKTSVLTVSNAVSQWKKDKFNSDNVNTLILFKNPATVLKAWNQGIKLNDVQIGGIEGAGNKKNINRNIVMSKEDVDNLKPLYDSGINLYCQAIPEDPKFDFKGVLAKF